MAYTLRTGEMLAAMHNAGMTHEAQQFQAALEAIGTLMADAISGKFGMGYTDATYDVGMVAATFAPNEKCPALPEALKGFDNEDEWGA